MLRFELKQCSGLDVCWWLLSDICTHTVFMYSSFCSAPWPLLQWLPLGPLSHKSLQVLSPWTPGPLGSWSYSTLALTPTSICIHAHTTESSHLGKQIEMKFNKKTGCTFLIRAEHGQTNLLTSPLFTHSQTLLYRYAFIFLHLFLAIPPWSLSQICEVFWRASAVFPPWVSDWCMADCCGSGKSWAAGGITGFPCPALLLFIFAFVVTIF